MNHLFGQRIVRTDEKYFVGIPLKMSFAENKTKSLWQQFMPLQKNITNRKGLELYSLQVYPPQFFEFFDLSQSFEKWALAEVLDFSNIPDGLHSFILPGGLYSVFHFKGAPEDAPATFEYIFRNWLPASGYRLDDRPHFEILGEKYKKDSSTSEEEIWIPITN